MSSLSGKQGPRYRHAVGDTEPYETIAVEKLTPIIGAEISGADIGRLVSDEARSNRQIDEIHRALAENLVIFFRDQHITPAQHLAFGRKFGELHIHPAAPHEGDDPALMKIYADKDSPRANGEAGTRTCPATSSRRWARSSTSSSARRAAAIRCLPICMR